MTLFGARLELNVVHWVLVTNVVVLRVELLVLLAEVINVIVVQVRRLGLLTQHVLVHRMPTMLTTLVQEDRIRYRPLSLTLQWRQILQVMLSGSRLQLWHRCDSRHVRLRTMARHFILNLEIVEAFPLVKSVCISSTSALFSG